MAITGTDEDVQVAIGGDSSGLRDELSSGIDRLTDFKTAVGVAGAALATLATKQLADAISASSDFESSMADVEKVVSDADVAGEIGDDIQELAEEIPLAHDQLAELATQAGRMGAEGSDEIAEFTEVAAQMGAATTLASDEAGMALGKMTSALDEPLDNVGELGDSINELSNNFQTTSDEIVDSTQRAGQALGTLGLESDEILGLSAAFNEVSPTSRLAATRMESVGEAMMDPDNVETFADTLGVTAEEFKEMREESPEETMLDVLDAVDGNQDAMDTLNDELTTAQARAFRDTADSADEMARAMDMSSEAMEEGGSLANEVAIETDTLSGQMDLLRNRMRNVAIDTGDVFLPHLRDAVALITRAADRFAELNERTNGMAGAVTLVIGILGGLTVAAGAVVASLGGLTAAAATATAALSPLAAGVSLLLGPVGLAIAAVALLAAAWHTDFMGIQGTTMEVIDRVRERINAFVEWASPYVEEFLDALDSTWQAHGEDLRQEVMETWAHIQEQIDQFVAWAQPHLDKFTAAVDALWEAHGDKIERIADSSWSTILTLVGNAAENLLLLVRAGLALIRGDWETFEEAIDGILSNTVESAVALFEHWFTVLDVLTGGAVSDLIDWFRGLYDALVGNSIIPELVDHAMAVFEAWTKWISGEWSFREALSHVVESATDLVLDTVVGMVGDAVSELSEFARSIAPDMAADAADSFRDAFNSAVPSSVSIPSRSVSLPEPLGGGSVSVGGGSLDLPRLASGGRVTGPGLAMVGERGDELVLNDEQTADADKGGVTVGDVEEDVRAALQESDRTDELLRRLDDLIRVVSQLSAGAVSQQDILEALEIARDRSGGRDPLADR